MRISGLINCPRQVFMRESLLVAITFSLCIIINLSLFLGKANGAVFVETNAQIEEGSISIRHSINNQDFRIDLEADESTGINVEADESKINYSITYPDGRNWSWTEKIEQEVKR